VSTTPDPIESAIDAYRRASGIMEPFRMKVWEEREFTVSQLRLTYLIRDHDNPSLGDLAEKLGITGATMSGLIDRLVKRGVVERVPDTVDRRIVRVRLTPEGEQLSSELERMGHEFLRICFEDLGTEDAAQLASLLDRFSDAMKKRVADGTYLHLLHGEQPATK
jgi:DNA-binding MarR family transcriptional regulator